MKYIKATPTGSYWRLEDGRIGYVTPHYARVTVLREGFRNNRWYCEPNEIGDRMYQINKKKSVVRKYKDWVTTGYKREYYANQMEGINALKEYEERNCTPLATYKRRFKELRQRLEFMYDYRDMENDTVVNEYQNGYKEGKNEILNKLNKILLNN